MEILHPCVQKCNLNSHPCYLNMLSIDARRIFHTYNISIKIFFLHLNKFSMLRTSVHILVCDNIKNIANYVFAIKTTMQNSIYLMIMQSYFI